MDEIRTTDLGLPQGTHFGAEEGVSPLDVCALVTQVQLKGLPAFNDDQRGEERAGKQLAQQGLTPQVIARLTALAASPPKKAWDQQPKLTPAQLAVQVLAGANTVAVPSAVAAAAKLGAKPPVQKATVVATPVLAQVGTPKRNLDEALTPPGFSTDGKFTAAMVAAVKHLESICPAAKVDVCPWYNIFGYCMKSTENRCDRCPRGGVCSQSMLDAVRVTVTHEDVAKVVITGPPVKNPSPGDGSAKKKVNFTPKGDG
jgi:hypothetical protein